MNIPKIMEIAFPDRRWSLLGNDYEGLTMLDGREKPTLKELEETIPQTERAIADEKLLAEKEEKIKAEMDRIVREQAITNLTARGII